MLKLEKLKDYTAVDIGSLNDSEFLEWIEQLPISDEAKVEIAGIYGWELTFEEDK